MKRTVMMVMYCDEYDGYFNFHQNIIDFNFNHVYKQ